MSGISSMQLIEANREKVEKWAGEGRAYFWIAKQLGINDRNAAAVSTWFLKQGIRRKAAK
jgi:hypothetical protein